jgi:hypothetical protein
VLPVVLTMAGLGGSWLAVLGIFVAWSWYLLAGAGAVIGAAWIVALTWRARPRVHVLLGVATVFFAAAVLTVVYEVEINRFVLAMWRGA